jgi:hypothetical protein
MPAPITNPSRRRLFALFAGAATIPVVGKVFPQVSADDLGGFVWPSRTELTSVIYSERGTEIPLSCIPDWTTVERFEAFFNETESLLGLAPARPRIQAPEADSRPRPLPTQPQSLDRPRRPALSTSNDWTH